MTARDVLKEALRVVERDHCAPPPWRTFLAVDDTGQGVKPLDPRAVAWTSIGAVCKVAPGLSATDPTVWADHVSVAWEAALLLDEAAGQQGYAHSTNVDRAGRAAALRMFWRALQLAEPDHTPGGRRRRAAAGAGSGSSPKGAAA